MLIELPAGHRGARTARLPLAWLHAAVRGCHMVLAYLALLPLLSGLQSGIVYIYGEL